MKNIIILFFLVLVSCNNANSELEYEKNVMNDLFIELIDAIYSEPTLLPPPPPPYPEIYYITMDQNIKDSIANKAKIDHNQFVTNFEKRVHEINSHSNKVSIAVFDTIYGAEKNYENVLRVNFGKENIMVNVKNNEVEYLFDLNDLNENVKYQFKYYSANTELFNILSDNYLSQPRSRVSFSRIQFDTTKKYGVFSGMITYSKHSGHGFLVLLKKENNKWEIDKIIDT